MANLPLGLTYTEVIWLSVIVIVPISFLCAYVTATLVSLSLIYVGFYLYRKSQTSSISISGQGVLITGCDTGEFIVFSITIPIYSKTIAKTALALTTYCKQASLTHIVPQKNESIPGITISKFEKKF